MEMEDKDRINALIELQKIRTDKYNQTRDLEFKINIALWTLIVLIGYYYRNTFKIETLADMLIFTCVTVIFVLAHYFLWLKPISMSEARDYSKALEFQTEIEKILKLQDKQVERTLIEISKDYLRWNLFLAGITLLLFTFLGLFFII
jgi:hypothetical protein